MFSLPIDKQVGFQQRHLHLKTSSKRLRISQKEPDQPHSAAIDQHRIVRAFDVQNVAAERQGPRMSSLWLCFLPENCDREAFTIKKIR